MSFFCLEVCDSNMIKETGDSPTHSPERANALVFLYLMVCGDFSLLIGKETAHHLDYVVLFGSVLSCDNNS